MPHIENLDIEERKAIEELEIRMKNDLPPTLPQDDTMFYRFLKARDFDVDKAEKMLRKNIEWRKIFQIDNILKDFKPKEVFVKHFEPNVLGHDKDGDVIIYSPIGKMESRDILKTMKMSDFLLHVVWFGEKLFASLKDYSEQTGRNANQIVFIFDLDGLTLSNATSKLSLEMLLRLTQITQNNHPERLKAVYMINAPNYYMIIFSIIKAIMSKEMLRKMKPFGHSGWKEQLLETIDRDTLPGFLGGKLTDPDGDPKCKTFVNHGGKIPQIYHLSKTERYFEDKNGVKKLLIPSQGKKEVHIEVTKNDSRIQWKFFVKGKDIGFGLHLQISEHDYEELIPIERFSTADGTEEGSYKCQSVGKYIATFDNSYSWLNSKEVEYHLTVISDN